MSARLTGVFDCTAEGWAVAIKVQEKYGIETYNLWRWFYGNAVCFHFTGLFRFYPQMAGELKLSPTDVEECLCDLVGEGLVLWDAENSVIYIPDVVRCQPNISFNKAAPGKGKQNSNRTHAVTQMKALPSCELVARFASEHGLEDPHGLVRYGGVREGVKDGGRTGGQTGGDGPSQGPSEGPAELAPVSAPFGGES